MAYRALVRPEARDLLLPVRAEHDACIEGLHRVAALARPVRPVADVHATDVGDAHLP